MLGNKISMLILLLGINVPRDKSSLERRFQGMKVPPIGYGNSMNLLESSTHWSLTIHQKRISVQSPWVVLFYSAEFSSLTFQDKMNCFLWLICSSKIPMSLFNCLLETLKTKVAKQIWKWRYK